MAYTSGQISEILLKADRTMYKIGTIAYNDMFSENSETLDYERDIIYIYKQSVEYADSLFLGTAKLDATVEKLAAKIAVYDFGLLNPVYSNVASNISNIIALSAALNDLTDVTISNLLNNQILRYDAGSGQWVNVGPGSAVRNSQSFIATAGQTIFTTSYPFDAGLFDVYLNGVRLNTTSFTTMGEYQITLVDAASAGDIIDVVIYDPSTSISNPINSLADLDDVLLGPLSNKHALYYNSASGKWENGYVFVPYTGAVQNVDLGEFGISSGYFQADLSPTQAGGVGRLIWNNTDGTLNLGLLGGNVTAKLAQQEFVRVVNGTGGNVLRSNYQAVKITGAQGQRLQVSLSRADNDNNSKDTIGLIAENINNNNEGFVIISGMIEDINTTGSLQGETWVDGDTLYLSGTTFGRLTNIKPAAPIHTVILGFVVHAHQNQGKIFVKVDNGYEIDELHNVQINTGTLANGQVLKYNATTQLWENNSDSGITGSGVSGQVAYWSGTNTQTGDSNLVWNAASIRLGIGRTATARRLEIQQGVGGIASALGIYKSDGSLPFIMGIESQSTDDTILAATTAIRFYSGSTIGGAGTLPTNERMRLFSASGNLLIQNGGTFTDSGQRLQVTGDTLLKGSGNTSATTALTVQNSDSTSLFSVRNDGLIRVGNSGGAQFSAPQIYTSFSNDTLNLSGPTLVFSHRTATGGGFFYTGVIYNATSGSNVFIDIARNIEPTSGTASFSLLQIRPSINQTGGSNGITRGLYVNPNLALGSGPADWRSIEWSNNTGWGLYGAGTANNYMAGSVGIGTSTLAAKLTVVGASTVIGQTNVSARFSDDLNSTLLISHPASTGAAATITGNEQLAFSTGAVGSIAERVRINATGSVGIGATTLTGYNLRISKNITGSITSGGITVDGIIQSGVTTSAWGFSSLLRTQAATFNLTDLVHFSAELQSIGAGSTITNQYGFYAVSNLVGATNNYGFYGNLASGTGRWNLYMNGTAANYLAGSLGIGTTGLSNTNLSVNKNLTGLANVYGIFNSGSIRSDVTTGAQMFTSAPSIQNAVFTLAGLKHFEAVGISSVGSATITSQFGFYVESLLTGATNNYGFFGNIASGTGRWNLYMNGSADNYLAGSLGIGATSLSGISLGIAKSITGSVVSRAVHLFGTVQSDVTILATGFSSKINIASAVTTPSLIHFFSEQGTISGTLTNQYGFVADASLTGATNNYGFYGEIPSGTGRWNLYMNGTALNYMAGNLLLGTTTDSGQRLQVIGDTLLRGSGNTSATTALTVQNSSSTNIFQVRNDGEIFATTYNSSGFYFNNRTYNATSGSGTGYYGFNTVNPTSGTAVWNSIFLQPTINQTGGANGITRGLYVNPTLTAAADWRSIEWSNNTGWGLYGAGTANNFLNGSLFVGSTTPVSTEKFGVYGTNAGGAFQIRVQNLGTTTNTSAQLTFTTNTSSAGTAVSSVIASLATDASGNTAMTFSNSTAGTGSEKMRLDASGNLGLGVTPSAWGNTKAIQAQNSAFLSYTDSIFSASSILTNAYFDGTNFRYIKNQSAGWYEQALNAHRWYNAPTGTAGNTITFTQAMTLFSTGNLAVGTTTDAGFRLDVNGTMRVSGASTFSDVLSIGASAPLGNERLNVTFTNSGGIVAARIHNLGTTANTSTQINLTTNTNVSGGAVSSVIQSIGTDTSGNTAMTFGNSTAGTFSEKMRLAPTGNLLINSTTDAGFRLDVNGTMRVSNNSGVSLTVGATTGGGTATTTPALITIGSTYGTNTAGDVGNLKLRLYDDGAAATYYGFGVSSNLLEISAPSAIAFFNGSATARTERFRIASTGAATFSNTVTFNGSTTFNSGAVIRSDNGTAAAPSISFESDLDTGIYRIAANTLGFTTLGTERLRIASDGAATFSSSVTAASYTINDAGNITIGTTTGTKICTATSQKIGFWNATPIVQPTTAVAAAAFVANTGTAVNDASTFDGYTMAQVVKALRNAGLLA